MSTNRSSSPHLHIILPDGFDDRSQFETPLRGYLSGVIVVVDGKRRYAVYFVDPVRLQQDLEAYVQAGQPYFAEPGLVVLPEVTLEAVNKAIHQLWESKFFDQLQPLKG